MFLLHFVAVRCVFMCRLSRKFYCMLSIGNVILGKCSLLMVFSLKHMLRNSMMTLQRRKKTRNCCE